MAGEKLRCFGGPNDGKSVRPIHDGTNVYYIANWRYERSGDILLACGPVDDDRAHGVTEGWEG